MGKLCLHADVLEDFFQLHTRVTSENRCSWGHLCLHASAACAWGHDIDFGLIIK